MPTGRPKVVVIGDSHVEALGPQLQRKLPELGVDVISVTPRRGWSTDRYNRAGDVARLVVAGGRPDAVILSLGGNDRPSTKSSFGRIVRTMVERVRSTGVQRIIWNGPATSLAGVSERSADAHRRHEQNADWLRDLLPPLGVTFIDSRPMTRTGHAPDGVHFTIRQGYPAWADQLKHEIVHALARPAPAGGKPGRRNGSTSIWVPIAIVGVASLVTLGIVLAARL